jgi:hypothetical protein
MKLSTQIGIVVLGILVLIGIVVFVFHRPASDSLSPAATTTSTDFITQEAVTFPAGNETLTAGSSYTLTWLGSVGASTTQIFLIDTSLESQGESVSITDRVYNVPATGSYQYTIPSTVPGGTYVFTIGKLRSNPFSIVAPKGKG